MNIESWRPIHNCPGYEVSDLGNVRSIRRAVTEKNTGIVRVFKGRVLKPAIHKGYPAVSVSIGGKMRTYYVHTLVAEAFVGPRNGQMRHLDGDKFNNTPANLKWGTAKENYADKVRHGTVPLGPRNWNQIVKEAHLYDARDFR